ncbi:MAG TPA: CPXCG motif-containing cysteine-rich protein [Campylobacterales bacterium]|nr:CPXCG motif-containing cysteine-rich protein [Campylobacterales bacterium]HHS93627.1 CPXCG motif-containing cysteine-rich protein [Campylobacterales bacterium]
MEHFFTCPYCWERISMVLEPDEVSSQYIEDCEICCRPIELDFHFSGDLLVSFDAQRMEGI